jgi:hypothetical protein
MIEQLRATLALYTSRLATVTGRMISDQANGRGFTREDLRQGEHYARLIIHTEGEITSLATPVGWSSVTA